MGPDALLWMMLKGADMDGIADMLNLEDKKSEMTRTTVNTKLGDIMPCIRWHMDEFHWRLLHYAAFHSFTSLAKPLLEEYGADPNVQSEKGDTPLHIAARQGSGEIVALLLQHGADPRKMNRERQTPVKLATDTKLITLLQSKTEVPPLVEICTQNIVMNLQRHSTLTCLPDTLQVHIFREAAKLHLLSFSALKRFRGCRFTEISIPFDNFRPELDPASPPLDKGSRDSDHQATNEWVEEIVTYHGETLTRLTICTTSNKLDDKGLMLLLKAKQLQSLTLHGAENASVLDRLLREHPLLDEVKRGTGRIRCFVYPGASTAADTNSNSNSNSNGIPSSRQTALRIKKNHRVCSWCSKPFQPGELFVRLRMYREAIHLQHFSICYKCNTPLKTPGEANKHDGNLLCGSCHGRAIRDQKKNLPKPLPEPQQLKPTPPPSNVAQQDQTSPSSRGNSSTRGGRGFRGGGRGYRGRGRAPPRGV